MSAATIRSSLLALAAALELACSTTVSRDDADVSDSATGQRDSSLVSPDGGGTDAPSDAGRAHVPDDAGTDGGSCKPFGVPCVTAAECCTLHCDFICTGRI
jgi:hypothetical protein